MASLFNAMFQAFKDKRQVMTDKAKEMLKDKGHSDKLACRWLIVYTNASGKTATYGIDNGYTDMRLSEALALTTDFVIANFLEAYRFNPVQSTYY